MNTVNAFNGNNIYETITLLDLFPNMGTQSVKITGTRFKFSYNHAERINAIKKKPSKNYIFDFNKKNASYNMEWEYKSIRSKNSKLKGFYYKFILPSLGSDNFNYQETDISETFYKFDYDQMYNAYILENEKKHDPNTKNLESYRPSYTKELYDPIIQTDLKEIKREKTNLSEFYLKIITIFEKFEYIPEIVELLNYVIHLIKY